MTRTWATTISMVLLAVGLAGCGGGEQVPVAFGPGATPVSFEQATYLVEPVADGRRAQATSGDAGATAEGAREAVLSAYGDLCGGPAPELRLFSDFIYPDGRREWTFLATCPANRPA